MAHRLATGAGRTTRCALMAMAEFAEKPLEKRSIGDLLQMAKLSREERSIQLHETLKVGLARNAVRLSEMPFGFCNAPSVRRVTATYVQNFQQVMEFEHQKGISGIISQDYAELTKGIFNQHRGTMMDVAKGVFEYYEDLSQMFGPDLELAEVREDLSQIRCIESALDEFFTNRLTLRLLISHVHSLDSGKSSGGSEDMVGVVNVNTQPIQILARAYSSARFMCMRDYKVAPDLLVNGVNHDEYILQEAAQHQKFAYVHTQLFYIFLELVKNAAKASVERALNDAGGNCDPEKLELPSLRVIVPEEQGLWDQERSVKLADRGTGMNRTTLSKAFCYFFSSVKSKPTVAEELIDFDRRVPLAGFGFGLPISRVMARYFAGDIDLNSIPGKGTDVYIYL